MNIKKLDYAEFEGRSYEAVIHSDRYLSIEPEGDGFNIEWKTTT